MNLPKREKAKKTRQDILEAARALFFKKGILNTSVSEIVKQAHVAKGTFYLYFETKDDVVEAIIHDNLTHFGGIFEKLPLIPVSPENCDLIVDRLMKAMQENGKVLHMMHEARFLLYVTDNMNRYHEYYVVDEIEKAVKAWLDRGVAQGLIQLPDTRFAASFIYQSFHAMIDMAIIVGTFTFEELGENLKLVLKRIIFMR